ncbi:MAG: 4-(cytidine 5'-diphospho)-2-C-methyl-D-erythritol kinase [Chloroflexi bacterium RBG_16_50_11]|nr:MAG: 4-(cytidine 5'-diphospho)-2-C-methyl-D-erythritol kinase [Chloroflexi bacterium RBG_16_50_11]
MLTLTAPAKINLTLEVLRKRPDGFHEIRSVLQAIDLADTLHIQEGKGISFRCDMAGWSAKQSLLSKTVELLKKVTKCKQGAAITIEKRIPLMSGLGGDSSDAAALLKGLNDFWGLSLSNEKLQELAVRLGSDVVFFLQGGTALATGRGEIISPLPPIQKMWVLLVFPDCKVELLKTARMYANLKPAHFTDGSITNKLAGAIKEGKTIDASLLFNVFTDIAFHIYDRLLTCSVRLIKINILETHLAGSGPTLFSIFRDKSVAEEVYRRSKEQGLNTYLAETL